MVRRLREDVYTTAGVWDWEGVQIRPVSFIFLDLGVIGWKGKLMKAWW